MRWMVRPARGAGLRRLALAIALMLATSQLVSCGLIDDILGRKPSPTPATRLGTPQATPPVTIEVSLTAALEVATATSVPAATATSQSGPTTYTVQSGDTLGAIANRFGVTTEAIVAANNLSDPDDLSIGQVLVIPAPGTSPTQAANAQPTAPAATPAPAATVDQGAAAPYDQAARLSDIGTWLTAVNTMVATLAADPAAVCAGQAEPLAGLQQQGQTLVGNLTAATPPAAIAALQQQLADLLVATNQSLTDAESAMCDDSDSAAAIAALLQASISVGQAQGTLGEVGRFLEQGTPQ